MARPRDFAEGDAEDPFLRDYDAESIRQLARGARPRHLHIIERDPSFPRDSDGCPTMSGVEWLINPLHVTAVKLVPDRGGSTDALVYVRGVSKPIPACEDGRGIAVALGVFEAECQMCGRTCDDDASYCRSCEGTIGACEDGDDDD